MCSGRVLCFCRFLLDFAGFVGLCRVFKTLPNLEVEKSASVVPHGSSFCSFECVGFAMLHHKTMLRIIKPEKNYATIS